MRAFIFLLIFISNISFSQNNWPKSYQESKIRLFGVYQDYDGGFLALVTTNNEGYSYLLKFDANSNLAWKKCIYYDKKSPLWGTRFFKDRFKNVYIVGAIWDSDTIDGDAFVLKLDSCYKKEKCVIYRDSTIQDQQYFIWNSDFNDSIFFASGTGFSDFFNQILLINKSNLIPDIVYNTKGSTGNNSYYSSENALYMPTFDGYYLKGGDTTIYGTRSSILKLDNHSGALIYYKFLGFDENIISQDINIYKNSKGNLFVFSAFLDIPNDTMNLAFSPMLFECDTSCNLIRYHIYNDRKINQILNNVMQYNDSTYIMVATYLEWGSSGFAAEKIKFYKLDAVGNVKDSFYMNNWGRNFFTKGDEIHLIKTFDNKIMCIFSEVDINLLNRKITFLKFDENFKLDTTEYRNKTYDSGCIVSNDSINLSGASIFQLHADMIYPILKLSKPTGIIKVAKEFKFSFYPNPIITNATFDFEGIDKGSLRIDLFDLKGNFVNELFFSYTEDMREREVKLNFGSISPGPYFIRVFLNNEVIHTIKMIKE